MNNEPVAWYSQRRQYFWTAKPTDDNGQDAIPLYTAPQPHPAKTLTDEEIIDCVEFDFVKEALHNKTFEYMWIIDFARAILRKAQE